MQPRVMQRWTLAVGVMALAMAAADEAEACGGLFCDAVQPVVQVDERIIFVDHDDDTVTAVVQIAYSGPAEQFAWVLPVDGVPEIGVSSNIAFTRLQAATDPSYTMTTRIEGECAAGIAPTFACAAGGDAFAEVANAGDGDGDIDVIASGSVGPYNYELISVADITDEDPAAAALRWLSDNGYEASALSADLFRPYLEDEMNLLAFRLNKQADVGEIRPVTLRYPSRFPMIPIKLTAVAAEDNMGVLVWNIADARAVPLNYLSLELNPALINWFNWQSNYFDVVNAAADEAGGQGFVTEMAQPSTVLVDDVWGPDDDAPWQAIRSQTWQGQGADLVDRVGQQFFGFDGLPEALRASVALPDGTSAADVLSCPQCERALLDDMDTVAFLDAVEDNVVEPMRDTQALLRAQDYVTRLYTTMSAEDMTLDPWFDYNPDLPDVSPVHTAERVVECNLGVTEFEAPWRAELDTGEVVYGEGAFNGWPVSPGDVPNNRRVLQVGISGPGEVIVDNTAAIQATLDAARPSVVAGAGCHTLRREAGLFEMGAYALIVFVFRRLLRRRRDA